MSGDTKLPAGEHLFRLLLRLYPREFRRRYAADMLDFYRDRVRHAGVLRAWIAVVPDLVTNAVAERFAWLHRDLDRAPAITRVYSHRRESTMSILLQDVRYALRAMRRRPGFTAVVLTTLALGIGANAAIFTVVNAVLLRPLALGSPERVVALENDAPYGSVSELEFLDYQRGLAGIDKLAAYSTPSIVIAGGDADPVRTYAARVSRDFFDVAGVAPYVGRAFAPDEYAPHSGARVAILGHKLWVQQFAADRAVVGKTMTINGAPFTIVGVMPRGFTFPDAEATLWIPWRFNPDSTGTRNNHYLRVVGRLGAGSSLEQVRSQARTLTSRWTNDFPDIYPADKPIRPIVTPIRDSLLGATRPYLLALLGAVGFVLLIACVNVANLLLVRGESRRKELAIRTALGASGSRIARQMLTESMMLAFMGALLGVFVALAGTRALVAFAPADLPRVDEVSVDGRVVLFTLAVTIVTGVVFGLYPALRMRRAGTADIMREGGKTSTLSATGAARRTLVVAEVALAVTMLGGAGLLVRSLQNLQRVKLGLDPANVMTMQVTLPPRKYNDTTADMLMQQLVARSAALPGATIAGVINDLPFSGNDNTWSLMIDNRVLQTVAEAPGARPQVVTSDYFRAMGVPLLRGRGFTSQDRADAPLVAVVSDGLAKALWPGVDPIGHTLRMFASKDDWVTVVGVAADVHARGIQREIPPTVYFPYAQSHRSAYVVPTSMTLVVKTRVDPASLGAPLRGVVRSLDPAIAISQVATMQQTIGESIASRRFTTLLLGGFAALALVLAGIGIYGVVSYGVSQRTYEIGVRVAMGASAASIAMLVMRECARMTVLGLSLGVGGALVVGRLVGSLLVDVRASDPVTLASVVALLALVAASAGVVPARRATAVSPTEALRNG